MDPVSLIATATFGLEAVVKRELQALGLADLTMTTGGVAFGATTADIPRLNLWLRAADRVLLKTAEFPATTFDDLYEQTRAVPWERWITADGQFPVQAKSHKSQLASVRTCQSIVKKAVVDRLTAAYQTDILPETGPVFAIQAALLKDTAVLTLDTSGSGLHKRGYRTAAGDAPLKETLAAGLVQLSFWNADRLLIDPLCGSGTILIEAALLARNIAPGLRRDFASEAWPCVPQSAWHQARQDAQAAIRGDGRLQIYGYDVDVTAVAMARANAGRAGVGDDIQFEQKDVRELWIDQQYGIMITNPPYGLRIAEFRDVNQIYIALNKMLRKKKGWSLYLLTADTHFPNYFKRGRPDRVRKLYNGSIRVDYYQYYGEKPPDQETG